MHEVENIGLLLREKRCNIGSNNVQRVPETCLLV